MSSGPVPVSIVMATYNGGEYLRPSLLSVLRQTTPALEVIIIDDGSTDGSIETIRDLVGGRVQLLSQENRGRPATLNRALDMISGDFYAIQDADDISHPARIERQLAALRDNPELAGVFCTNDVILDGLHVAPLLRGKSVEQCRRDVEAMRMPAHDTTAMYRVDRVKHLRYDETLPFVEAYDYIIRIGEQSDLLVMGECLYSYRVHFASITRRDPRARLAKIVEACHRAYERRGLDAPLYEPSRRKRLTNRDIDNNLAAYFIESAQSLRDTGLRLEAMEAGWQCAALHPFDAHYWKALVYALMPASGRGR